MAATEVPAASYGPPTDPARSHLVEEIRGGVWWLTDGDYRTLLVTSTEGTLVVDAPPPPRSETAARSWFSTSLLGMAPSLCASLPPPNPTSTCVGA